MLSLALSQGLFASSEEALSLEGRVAAADGVLVGTILSVGAGERDERGVFTRVVVEVEEELRGQLPRRLEIRWPGGDFGDRVLEVGGFELPVTGSRHWLALLESPEGIVLSGPGSHRRLAASKVAERSDAARVATAPPGWVPPAVSGFAAFELAALRAASAAVGPGGADWRAREADVPMVVQNLAPGFTPGSGTGVATRLAVADRGPLVYYVDADILPTGITLEQGLDAVHAAIAAWAGASGLQFRFGGTTSFGASAETRSESTNALYIQLHDLYEEIPDEVSTLGIGGSWRAGNPALLSGTVGLGGRVGAFDFARTVGAFVVMEHKRSFFASNPTNFAEVLTHEIGHAIGLAHSSENPSETDTKLKTAIMFALAQGSGRGPVLADYDREVIVGGYPSVNRVPATWPLYLAAVTKSGGGLVPGAAITLPVIDPEGATLTPILVGAVGTNGTFSMPTGRTIAFAANGGFASNVLPASGNSYYDRTFVTFDDGVNRSAPVEVRVMGFQFDQQGDGLPDNWANTHFGSATPVAGLSRPEDDPDLDGFTNLAEYRAGTNPRDASSPRAAISLSGSTVSFVARPYDVVRVEQASSPAGPWTLREFLQPTASPGTALLDLSAGGTVLIRITSLD